MKPRRMVCVAAALMMTAALVGCGDRPDSVSGASLQVCAESKQGEVIHPGRPVIVTPSECGGAARLGSGVFDQAHHKALLELAERVPPLPGRRAFIFSTSGVFRGEAPGLGEEDPHKALRERLTAKGFEIVGEFNCVGYNDNSFLFLIGGINKGHPNARDLALAEAFADSLLRGGGK